MNIKDWIPSNFFEGSQLTWPCPNCNNTSLTLEKDRFISEYSADTKAMMNEVYFEPEWSIMNFAGSLLCASCKSHTMVGGTGTIKHYSHYDPFSKEYDEGYTKVYTPNYFQPTLNLFEIPEKCAEMVKDEILNSFHLFWSDLASCANKIRIALELLMNQQNVKRTTIVAGKRKRISLHNRIVEFKKKNAQVGTYLEAIKWIGNSGSHVSGLERIDVLEAYELLEYSLNKLFKDKESEIIKMSNEIISRKGVRKRR